MQVTVTLKLLLLLAGLVGAQPYERNQWTGPTPWLDEDGDCQNTRAEVLIRDSRVPVTFWRENRCNVRYGLWVCPYSGDTARHAADVDIDHIVALAEAHRSGGYSWTKDMRRRYTNDMSNLQVTSRRENRDKGGKDPAHWLPARNPVAYVALWTAIKLEWSLDVDSLELAAVRRMLREGR